MSCCTSAGFALAERPRSPNVGAGREGGVESPAGRRVAGAECGSAIVCVEILIAIASTAFGSERFHQDPRIDRKAADQRYANWVEDSLSHATQKLYCVTYDEMIVALFVTENREPNSVYWHLTALDPTRAGVGLGEQVWRAMLDYHASSGSTEVKTKIAVRNTVVMNLYAKLGFRFEHPEMTFHWMRSGEMC